jgi:predicted RNase H-like nuclease (RuvC/YqgF family)
MEDRKTQNELFNLYLDNMETGIKALIHIIPIVWKFDRKVYNAKFENAIKKSLEEYETELKQRVWTHVFLDVNRFSLEIHYTNRSVKGSSCWEYLPSCYDEDRLSIYSKYSCYGDNEENKNYHDEKMEGDIYYFYIDSNYNNRIKSQAIVKAIEEKIKDMRQEIANLKEEVKKLDLYEKKAKELKDAMEELHKNIPYCFTDFFDLKTYATYN